MTTLSMRQVLSPFATTGAAVNADLINVAETALSGPEGLAVAVTTPEPSTLVLLGVGATSLLGYRWRRRTGRLAAKPTASSQDAPATVSFPSRTEALRRVPYGNAVAKLKIGKFD
jgi:hypothetical protein